MTKTIPLLIVATLAVGAHNANAENCLDSIQSSTPVARFVVTGELAFDQKTGLQWQRCAIGYDFDDGGPPTVLTDDACLATDRSEFSWAEALLAAESLNQAGGIGGLTTWRVPNNKELQSIVEYQCYSPAINLALFPDTTVARPFWSSSPRRTIVNFLNGTVGGFGGNRETDFNQVRLVTDGAAEPPPPVLR